MPELPEVETTRRQIEPLLVGHRIERVLTTAPSYFFLTAPEALRRHLAGRTGKALDREGKYLVLRFEDDARLLLHLGMTGQLFERSDEHPVAFGDRPRGAHPRGADPIRAR